MKNPSTTRSPVVSLVPSLAFSLESSLFPFFFPLIRTPPKYLEYKSDLACYRPFSPPTSPLPLCTFRPLLLSFLAILSSMLCVCAFLSVGFLSADRARHALLTQQWRHTGERKGGGCFQLIGSPEGGSAVVAEALIGWSKEGGGVSIHKPAHLLKLWLFCRSKVP